jgi:hypothetical protein
MENEKAFQEKVCKKIKKYIDIKEPEKNIVKNVKKKYCLNRYRSKTNTVY